jgi:YHS domain-containing protein
MKNTIIFAAALLAMNVAAQAADEKKTEYPLKICVVSGETLGEHGDPYIYNYKGREVRFCCKDCVPDFNKDPETYLKQLDDAAAAEKDAGEK